MILDAGNSVIKAKITWRDRGKIAFSNALRPLTETEYQTILARAATSESPRDYFRINGQAYVVGESADHHGVHTQPTGAARYTRNYYCLFAAAALGRLYERGGDVMIFGSHPPGDINFREA